MSIFKKIFGSITKESSAQRIARKQVESKVKPSLEHILDQFSDCLDLEHQTYPQAGLHIVYLSFLVGDQELEREIVQPFANASVSEVRTILERSQYKLTTGSKECVEGILDGQAAIFFQGKTFLVKVAHPVVRQVAPSDTESIMAGPHDAFVENNGQNISLIRQRLKSSHLKTIKLTVGEVTKTEIILLYIADFVDPELLQMLKERIQNIEIDAVYDGNMLVQLIEEHPNSIFPQFLTTERPDVIVSKLLGGRIVGLVDGSPTAFSGPASFFEFFSSADDYYLRWPLGSALRLLRFLGLLITVNLTAVYVSVTTFHYEMIPHTMLLSLTESRSKVPFPPLIEALAMETTIELLREAGARLPSKIGQTIGIVGGIVIGTAAVQAGFTSNILIIAAATSAIASFVTPSYLMSGSIRLARFGLIILAGIWGNFGLVIGITLLTIHLAGITNLGTSYLTPLAPFTKHDLLDSFIRGPYWSLKKRPSLARSPNMIKQRMRQ